MSQFKKINKDGSVSIKYLKELNQKKNWFFPLRQDRETKENKRENISSPSSQSIHLFNIYGLDTKRQSEISKFYNNKIDLTKIPIFLDQIKNQLSYKDQKLSSEEFHDYSCSNLHIGQRKLLITEILFLSMYNLQKLSPLKKEDLVNNLPANKKIPIVIYAGAGPGTHLLVLLKLFPGIVFHNYDMTKFDKNLVKNNYKFPNNFLYQQLFLDKQINHYSYLADQGYLIYFMSDIRTAYNDFKKKREDIKKSDLDNEFEECVRSDNNLMEKFITKIKPISTLFKFRLPFNSDSTYKYLDGKIMLQPWSKNRSTECRLIIENLSNNRQKIYPYKEYDKQTFENSFCYLNLVIKYHAFYLHTIPCSGYYPYDSSNNQNVNKYGIGIDHGYNSSFEIITWCIYLGYNIKDLKKKDLLDTFIKNQTSQIIKFINETTSIICRNLKINCHGLLPDKTNLEKLEFFTDDNEKKKFNKRLLEFKNENYPDIKCKYEYYKPNELYFLRNKKYNSSLKTNNNHSEFKYIKKTNKKKNKYIFN